MFEEENDETTDLDYSIPSVTVSDWEQSSDTNVSASYSMPPCAQQYLSSSSYVAFCNALNTRRDISKLSAHIGSCSISS